MAKYSEWLEADKLTLITAWARDGLTDEQIANNMGITTSTFYDWKKRFSDISEALKKGKEVVDYEVENALLKRALGYTYDEVTKEYGVVTKAVTKQVAPDVGAAMAWLKNRKPDKWRDKPQEKENPNTLNNQLVNVAQLINNPKPVRTAESLEEGDSNE